MKELGLVGKDVTSFSRLPTIRAWDNLTPEQRKLSARKMEIDAAMLANMDYHIGRVLDHLKKIGKLDDTVVIFISDNGAESIDFSDLVEKGIGPQAKKWVEATFDTRLDNWGKKGSIVDYGAAWAQVSSVPFAFNRAVRQGDWKLVYLMKSAGGTDEWRLSNLREDPAELRDRSNENPDKRKALLALWEQYVKDNGVILTGDGLFKKLCATRCGRGCRLTSGPRGRPVALGSAHRSPLHARVPYMLRNPQTTSAFTISRPTAIPPRPLRASS